MRILFGFLSGLVFGVGLVISGMSDPAKVLNFLDVLGPWDPSLAFVMGGASVTAFIGYRLVWRREKPVLTGNFDIPTNTAIDRPLLTGATLFGIGWGVGGFCPGPAWTALPLLAPGTLVFIPAMLIGLWLGSRAKGAAFFNQTSVAA
ncbi:YeeE/YedE family protein [Rhizobiaceae bacterium]|nr:YeeE/YedE family protein [Rhizobiaceae bacterium]